MEQRLKGQVALVTGASRGVGRGIALVLGEEGATVYVTGRSVRGRPTTGAQRETIDETAEMVMARGGAGIAVRCDHTVDADVEALFERIKREQGQLNVLVNNVWGGYEEYDSATFDAPFWEQPIWRWDKMFTAGARAHYTASRLAAPLMISQGQGLVINTTFWDRGKCLGSLPYDLAKTVINRLAYVMALELRPYGVASVALSPGWMRTEAVLRTYDTDEQHWQEVPDLEGTESTQYIGRAVVSLAADPNVMEKSGRILTVGDLAREYGFTDYDGRQPPTFVIADKYLKD
ncbi:MAG: SDR family oxidoreductase [Anaerolineae bacterium]|jgi:NAD(P)-dependent dehydrogenase (short-subunit alcohol dehydrogenase family)